MGTTDPDLAADLLASRLRQLEQARRNKLLLGIERKVGLEAYASEHLVKKKDAGEVRHKALVTAERHLHRAVEFFGADTDIASIRAAAVSEWSANLQRTRSNSTVIHHLNDLSNMFRRAVSDGAATRNPVADMFKKPRRSVVDEPAWLDVSEAALLLEAARRYEPPKSANPYIYEVLATMLLTGGRKAEVLGLEVDDISLSKKTVTFRPNDWRPLKTKHSARVVTLWPQLEEILRSYLLRREREAPLGRLLFPSPKSTADRELMLDDLRKVLNAISVPAGWREGELTTKIFRHTYCAARLQNLDRGQPIAVWTVSRELGHASTDRVENVYGHLGDVRHRSEVVEYRVEQHADTLRERLAALA